MFLVNPRFISHSFLLFRPSQRSARSQVPSQVATHHEIGSQLWAGETPDSNPGLQDNSQARYHLLVVAKRISLPFHLVLLRTENERRTLTCCLIACCCNGPTHCINKDDEDFSSSLLSDSSAAISRGVLLLVG